MFILKNFLQCYSDVSVQCVYSDVSVQHVYSDASVSVSSDVDVQCVDSDVIEQCVSVLFNLITSLIFWLLVLSFIGIGISKCPTVYLSYSSICFCLVYFKASLLGTEL